MNVVPHVYNRSGTKRVFFFNCLENLYIKLYQQQGKLISQQNYVESNSVYKVMYDVELQHAYV